jgi:type II secretory pathway component PulC
MSRRSSARGWNDRFFGGAIGLVLLGLPLQTPPPPPYSVLPLDLVGVIVSTAVPSNSVCLIRCTYPSKKDDIFRTGQKTFEYAEILEIRRDGVVIRNLVTNLSEFLTFAKNKPFVAAAPKPPAPAPAVLAKSPDAFRIELPKDTISYYLKNLPELLNSAFAAPRYVDGKNGERVVQGFEISRIKEASIVEQMGLRNGDVILDVNGEPLDGMATVMRLLGGIQNAPQAKMTVLRGGQKMSFVIDRK